jgi:hypothetical protein
MKALLGAVFGIVISFIGFFANYYDQLLLVGRGQAGLLMSLQLSNAVTTYMFGGAILGAIIGLSMNKEVK